MQYNCQCCYKNVIRRLMHLLFLVDFLVVCRLFVSEEPIGTSAKFSAVFENRVLPGLSRKTIIQNVLDAKMWKSVFYDKLVGLYYGSPVWP